MQHQPFCPADLVEKLTHEDPNVLVDVPGGTNMNSQIHQNYPGSHRGHYILAVCLDICHYHTKTGQLHYNLSECTSESSIVIFIDLHHHKQGIIHHISDTGIGECMSCSGLLYFLRKVVSIHCSVVHFNLHVFPMYLALLK